MDDMKQILNYLLHLSTIYLRFIGIVSTMHSRITSPINLWNRVYNCQWYKKER